MAIVIKDKDGRLMQYQDGVLTPLPDQGVPSARSAVTPPVPPQPAPVVQTANSKQPVPPTIPPPAREGDVSVRASVTAPELDLPEPSHELLRSRLQAMLTSIEQEIGVVYTDKKLEERFRNIMSLRLRGVRSARETVEALQKPKSIGGLELNASQTDMVTRVLEGKVADFTAMWKEEELQKMAKIEQERAVAKQMDEERTQQETQKVLDAKVQTLAMEKGSLKAQKAVALDRLIRAEAGSGDAIIADLKSRAKEKPAPTSPLAPQVKPPTMPAAPVTPSAATPQSSVLSPAGEPSVPPVSSLVQAVKPVPRAGMSVSPLRAQKPVERDGSVTVREEVSAPTRSAPPSASYAERPRMVDVKSAHALTGPLDEMAGMTLKDFRLLAAQPHDAGLKLKSKIDNLEAEHYGMRLAGLTALWNSPLMRLYGNIIVQAIAQKIPVEQAVTHQADIQSPGLTLDEFRVLLELSTELRF